MEKYLGTKIIDTEPMNKYEFYMNVKGIDCKEENEEGYKVVYQDGYVSWSPKDVFEEAYHRISQPISLTRKEDERAYPFPNGEYKPYIIINDGSVTFIGQGGPIKEVGVNGCQIDDIIEFAKDVLTVFNQRVPCRETSMMITKLDEALLWSLKRKIDREKRNVEGTSQK